MTTSVKAIYVWLSSDAEDEGFTRLVTLVMAVAKRCAKLRTLSEWYGAMALAAPIEAQAPSGRLAIRLILAYAAGDDDSAFDLLLPLLRSSTLESLPDELTLTFLCLATLHDLCHETAVGRRR